mgnify:CR=1 FL=1
MSKNFILIGASSAISKALIGSLDSTNTVYALTRDASNLNASDYDCHPTVLTTDTSSLSDVSDTIARIAGECHIDGVVNFCGSIVLKPMHLLTEALFRETLDINLMTSFNVAHAVTSHIKKDCQIIFLSTSAAHIGLPNHEAIAAAKYAVEGLSKSIAATYASANIRSNVLAPGLVDSPLSSDIFSSERAKAVSQKMHGLSRLGVPSDISACLRYMLLEATWMTGEVIRIDGGLSTMKSY